MPSRALAATSPSLGTNESLWMMSADAVADDAMRSGDGDVDADSDRGPAGPSAGYADEDWEEDCGNGVRCLCFHEYYDHQGVLCVFILAAYDAPMRVRQCDGGRRCLMVFTMAGTLVGSIDVGEGRSVRAVRTLLFDDITCTHSAKAKNEIGIESDCRMAR